MGIAQGVASGAFSCAEVCETFIERCEQTHAAMNALVVPLFDEAKEQARALDARRARGELLGRLAGVPFSVKESFHVRGTPATIGLGYLTQEIAEDDAPLVQALRAAGAILLGKTNVPQLMAAHECQNPVYGRTLNPWNASRTCGGSTGGEAAIIAAGGSLLGLGSDLGGSLRVPAHFCGVSAFKPTPRRLTRRGSRSNFRGMQAMEFQPGPLARRVADLALAFSVMAESRENLADTEVAPRAIQEFQRISLRGLRIGVCVDDGFFTPALAVRRVVEEAAAALSEAGAHLEPFVPPNMPEPVLLYSALMTADGGAGLRQQLGPQEPQEPQTRKLLRLMGLPQWIRLPLAQVLDLGGQTRAARTLRSTGPISAAAFWKTSQARVHYERTFLAELERRRLDAIVLPPYALAAVRFGQSVDLASAASYTFLANVVGLPAGIVAASRVRAGEETQVRNRRDWVERAAMAAENESLGLPLGVQVAALPFHDHVALAVMQTLEDHFSTQSDWPLGISELGSAGK